MRGQDGNTRIKVFLFFIYFYFVYNLSYLKCQYTFGVQDYIIICFKYAVSHLLLI